MQNEKNDHSSNLLDSQVDVLLDTETEVPVSGEVFLPQLVFLDLEPTFQNLFGLKHSILTHSNT